MTPPRQNDTSQPCGKRSAAEHRADGLQAQPTVRLYKGNRLDQAHDYNPDELAKRFIDAAANGELTSPGRGLGWAFRSWLTSREGPNSTWDEVDWPTMESALHDQLRAHDPLYHRLAAWAWGES